MVGNKYYEFNFERGTSVHIIPKTDWNNAKKLLPFPDILK